MPGAGQTRDNVVAWSPEQRVLFGGCLLKPTSSGGLGNTADSVLADRPQHHRWRSSSVDANAVGEANHTTHLGLDLNLNAD
jgi:hypothetical protein